MVRAPLRVIVDDPRDAALNMGIDDVLLAGEGSRFAYTLRLYRWSRPTVSLGYSQAWEETFDPLLARRLGIDLVRRRTGGRAVLHDDELTYSIVGPSEEGPLAGGIHATYRAIAGGLADGLTALGAVVELVRGRARSGAGAEERRRERAPCFAVRSRYELVADGRKLLGSAQRRARGRVLQHGSLPIGAPDVERWRVLGDGGPAAARDSVGLAQLIGRRPSFERVALALAHGVAESLDLEPFRRGVGSMEWRRAVGAARRYRRPEFTRRV